MSKDIAPKHGERFVFLPPGGHMFTATFVKAGHNRIAMFMRDEHPRTRVIGWRHMLWDGPLAALEGTDVGGKT